MTTSDAALAWTHFLAGETSFFRAPVLVTGPTEALMIDGGFTFSDGKTLADEIKATGKAPTAVYISQSNPDYYFSLKPILDAFPDAKVLAASETIAAIKANVESKLAIWGPQLKVDGQRIEIVAAHGLANRRYLWVPSLGAIFEDVQVFSGTYVWTAIRRRKKSETPGSPILTRWPRAIPAS